MADPFAFEKRMGPAPKEPLVKLLGQQNLWVNSSGSGSLPNV
jgi:hypothetical protein